MVSIQKIIKEVVNNFVNEELSINNELECSVNELCDKIERTFASIDKQSYTRTGVTLSDGTQSLVSGCAFNEDLEFMGKRFRCLISIRVFWDKQTLIEFYERFNIGSEFSQHNNFFTFVLPCIKGEGLDRQFMFNNVYHEVEHSLQYIMIGDNTLNDVYKRSLSLMNNQIPNDIQGETRDVIMGNLVLANLIATVCYFYYPLEIDANINGLYGELLENGLNKQETNYWINKTEAERKFKEILEYGENDEINLIYNVFGFKGLKQFIKYIRKQQEYITRKEMKVIQRAKNKLSLQESINFTSHHSKLLYIKGFQ